MQKQILVRCTESEFGAIHAGAKAAGLSLPRWIVARCLGAEALPGPLAGQVRSALEAALRLLPDPEPVVAPDSGGDIVPAIVPVPAPKNVAITRRHLERLRFALADWGVRASTGSGGYAYGTLGLVSHRGTSVRVASDGVVSLFDPHEGTQNQRVLTPILTVDLRDRKWPLHAAKAIAEHLAAT